MNKKYWCVVQRYTDDFRVRVMICEVEARRKPPQEYSFNRTYDEYRDYFNSRQEAEEFAQQVVLA